MKLAGFILSLLLVFNGASFADEVETDAVLATTTAEIKSGKNDLSAFRLVSTGQPDAELLQLIKDAGFAAVVDLRAPGEPRGIDEAALVESLGMQYIALPVAGPSDLTSANATILDQALAGIDGPVLLHCASGNRVGALMALRARQQGATEAEALAAGKRAGLTHWEAIVAEQLRELPR